ncbi:MAG: transglutaminase family protein [Verrucomicrobiales bacterium]
MRFFVSSSLQYQVSGPATLLCSLRCSRTAGQRVLNEQLTTSRYVPRTELSVGLEENRFTKFDVEDPGDLGVQYGATVETSETTVDIGEIGRDGGRTMDSINAEALPYLFPSRYSPADRMRAAAMDLFGGIEGKFDVAMAIEDWLFEHIVYQVGSSAEQSWSLDTFEQRAGVCRDFAHLGIAFCRALTIPARYVTVYAYQLEPQDFHALFEVYIGGRWYVVDGTRKVPLNGLVRIATGRDASDAAVATLFGNVMGQGIQVWTQLDRTEEEAFKPMTRESLRDEGKALFLS